MENDGGQHDEALIRELRGGSRDAWAALYRRYSAGIWRYVARLVGSDRPVIADIVQEVFLAARSARHFDESRGTVWSWLSGVAHHHVLSHWRAITRSAKFHPLTEAEEAAAQRLFDPAAAWEELFEHHRLCELVRHVLAQLPEDYAALLTGKYLDELSLDELVQRSGASLDSVKSKLARARREFREKFERVSRESASIAPSG